MSPFLRFSKPGSDGKGPVTVHYDLDNIIDTQQLWMAIRRYQYHADVRIICSGATRAELNRFFGAGIPETKFELEDFACQEYQLYEFKERLDKFLETRRGKHLSAILSLQVDGLLRQDFNVRTQHTSIWEKVIDYDIRKRKLEIENDQPKQEVFKVEVVTNCHPAQTIRGTTIVHVPIIPNCMKNHPPLSESDPLFNFLWRDTDWSRFVHELEEAAFYELAWGKEWGFSLQTGQWLFCDEDNLESVQKAKILDHIVYDQGFSNKLWRIQKTDKSKTCYIFHNSYLDWMKGVWPKNALDKNLEDKKCRGEVRAVVPLLSDSDIQGLLGCISMEFPELTSIETHSGEEIAEDDAEPSEVQCGPDSTMVLAGAVLDEFHALKQEPSSGCGMLDSITEHLQFEMFLEKNNLPISQPPLHIETDEAVFLQELPAPEDEVMLVPES